MKTYIQPETKVVVLNTIHVMAASQLGVSNTPTNNVVGDARDNNSWDIWGSGDYEED